MTSRSGRVTLPLSVALSVALVVGVALTLAVGLLGVLNPAAAPAHASAAASTPAVSDRPRHGAQVAKAPVPRLVWERCGGPTSVQEAGPARALAGRISCATAMVPLDYDRPKGRRTPLLLLKVAAARPAQRIGTLFVNPGGPGGSSTDFAPQAARALGPRVAARFDVVGIDPRGVGGSGAATCRGRVDRPGMPWTYPVTEAETAAWLRHDRQVRRACRLAPTALVDHASTADTARDMELIRRALREPRISYYGISYGTYLGATYAAMFPGKVRTMVVDGVLDPVAWSTGPAGQVTEPFSTRLGSDLGAQEALTAALARCDRAGTSRCSLAPGAQQKWDRVIARAAVRPIRFQGERVDDRHLYSFATSLLYDRELVAPLMDYVAGLDRVITAPRTAADPGLARLQRRVERVQRAREAAGPWGPTSAGAAAPARAPVRHLGVQPQAVMCSDSRNPQQPRAWVRAAAEADRTAPGFGSLWTWLSSICAREGIGSGADSYRGPWVTRTAYPLLVVGNSHDPATPIHGARRVHELFAGSRLVTYDGWGHGAIGTGTCIRRTMAAYLVDRTLPREGRVCPGSVLFPRRQG